MLCLQADNWSNASVDNQPGTFSMVVLTYVFPTMIVRRKLVFKLFSNDDLYCKYPSRGGHVATITYTKQVHVALLYN